MEKENMWKAAAVAGGVIVGILALRYVLSEDPEVRMARELKEDMEKINTVSKDSSGTIKLQDFIELFRVVTRHSKIKIKSIKEKYAAERRRLLKEGDDEGYKENVRSQMNEEEQIYQEIATKAMEFFNIEENDFLIAQQVHMNNPLFQKTMAEIQLNVENLENYDPPIDKEKAKEIFIFIENQKFKTMENIVKKQSYPPTDGSDTTITLLVEHAKIGDMMYEKYGIEGDEFAK